MIFFYLLVVSHSHRKYLAALVALNYSCHYYYLRAAYYITVLLILISKYSTIYKYQMVSNSKPLFFMCKNRYGDGSHRYYVFAHGQASLLFRPTLFACCTFLNNIFKGFNYYFTFSTRKMFMFVL